jgi:hypothetical protein
MKPPLYDALLGSWHLVSGTAKELITDSGVSQEK